MNKINKVLIFLITFVSISVTNSNENIWTKKNIHKKIFNRLSEKLEIPGCKSSKIWMMIKRGNRGPTMKDIYLIGKRLPRIRNLILKYNPTSSNILHDYDLRAFRKWDNKLNSHDYYKLPTENEKELMHVAERMRIRFPSLLSKGYDRDIYKLKYAESKGPPYFFTMGLFDDKNSRSWYDNTSRVDTVAELSKICEAWKVNRVDNAAVPKLKQQVSSDILISQTVDEINERLKLPEDTINFEDIHLMHTCCLFETASNISTKSPWCSAFSVHHLKVLKYLEDVKYFSEHEHSRISNERKSCVAFDDLITFMKSEDDARKCTIYFTNSGAIMRVLLFFDKYNDEFSRKNLGIAHVNPFETNLAFVLYNCHGVFKVLTLFEEHVIKLPFCPFTILCELNKISEYYSHICAYDEICEKKEQNNRIELESFIMFNRGSNINMNFSIIFILTYCKHILLNN
ncbi:multiple inositol polyphosphate phosphatase 1-like [Coccinella septempunctata]|uniref:multiple inositol polyphosphate phosphatase 1-like n=1 Tax=Coccinella septempunctata TaxID=41139 RepID=UPI001D0839AF|nr:multiple inositol polyphosphate phosphatase 1-like [Coccinella septempunctata]